MAEVAFTSEENINRKRKYIIPWNQIDLKSDRPIREFRFDHHRDMVCSEGNIVNFSIDDGSFAFAQLDDSNSFLKFLYLSLKDPFDKEVTWPRAVSNDGTLAVGLVQTRSTERMNLRSHAPVDEGNSIFVESTMLKVFNSDKEKEITCKKIFGGQRINSVRHIKISPNNNLVAVIYLIYQHRFECKIFKFTDKGGCKHFRRFSYRHNYADNNLGSFESSFNVREDLYMINLKDSGSDGSNSTLIYDINKKKFLMNFTSVPGYFQAYLICTQNQNLVYVYEEENLLSCYDLADLNHNREPITSWNIEEDFGIIVFDDSIYVHHFIQTRVYVSSGRKIHVLCPFKKTILQTFVFPIIYNKDADIQKIVINWSGEEIFFLCRSHRSFCYDVFAYFFCEDKEKHLTLKTLARRAVHSSYTWAHLQKLNLPLSVKALLGVP